MRSVDRSTEERTVLTPNLYAAAMKAFLVLIGFILVGCSAAQTTYDLTLEINGEAAPFTVEGAEASGSQFSTDAERATINFEGGSLDLNLTDWDVFDYAHVLGVSLSPTAENTYTVSATVRHFDQGWDNYADAFEVTGESVENGLRVLAHPHDNEQPFTRSQSGVVATGIVTVSAKDNVEGPGGSTVTLDLAALPEAELSWRLTEQ